MKRKISLILSVLCLFVLMVALASCGHEHAYSDKWTNDANNHWHVCDVEGDECSEVSGKAAHTFQEKSKVEATCTAVGELTEACSVCGYEKKTEIPMVAHEYADETCTAPKTCINCSATDGEALGHDEQYEVVPPTCTEDGYTAITCSRCDYSSTKDPVDALGHDEQYEVVPPTCTEAGITNITCSRCDYTSTKDPVDALGHDEQYDVVPPTCTEAGITNITCSRCDYTSTKDPKDALGHDEQYEVINPTCTDTGITNITCSRCDYTSTKDPTDALGHTGGTASCIVLAVCTRCEKSYGEYADHVYKTEDAVEGVDYEITTAPTCITEGVKTYKCTVCAQLATDANYIVAVDKIAHNYDVKGETTAPTCITKGYTTYSCSAGACGTTENRDEVAEIDHAYDVKGETTAPTCITKGYTTYSCSAGACGKTENRDETAEIQHNYDVKGETTAPTCITKGYTTYSCSAGACGKTEQKDFVDEIAHSYDVKGETTDPTCSAEGYTTYSCSAGACETTVNKDFTARTAHNLVELNEYGEVSCIECGATYRNITTIVTVGSGELCLDCGKEECDCNVNVEWSGYVKPSAPEAITAGVAFTKNSIPEKENKALQIGGGLIRLESAEETTYTIVIGDSTITVTGTIVVVDLYKFESVASVTITAEADATVSFYEKI